MAHYEPNPRLRAPTDLVLAITRVLRIRIRPLLEESVAAGNPPFGAAVFSGFSLAPITVAVNKVRESPLLHGEANCIREFFLMPASERLPTSHCIFFATHEPCSLCLSAIAWAGFPKVYYLFTHQETRRLLGNPDEIDILEEVFRVPSPNDTDETIRSRPLYNRENKYFTAKSVKELVDEVENEIHRSRLGKMVDLTKAIYQAVGSTPSTSKEEHSVPEGRPITS